MTESLRGGFFSYYLLFLIQGAIAAFAILLVYIGYLFEARAYTVLLGPIFSTPVIPRWELTGAEALALGLNGAKVGLIFIITRRVQRRIGAAFHLRALRALVLLLSLLMTLLVFAGQMISPNAEARLAQLEQQAAARHARAETEVQTRFDARLARFADLHAEERERLNLAHAQRLAVLDADLTKERNIGGQNFRGARYQELDRPIEQEKTAFIARSDELRAAEQAALAAIETERQTALDALVAARGDGRIDETLADVFGTTEAQHPYMLRMVELIRTVVSQDWITPASVTVLLTLLVSLVIELLPIVMLAHVFGLLSGRADTARSGASTEKEAVKGSDEITNVSAGHTNDPRRNVSLVAIGEKVA